MAAPLGSTVIFAIDIDPAGQAVVVIKNMESLEISRYKVN